MDGFFGGRGDKQARANIGTTADSCAVRLSAGRQWGRDQRIAEVLLLPMEAKCSSTYFNGVPDGNRIEDESTMFFVYVKEYFICNYRQSDV